MCKKLRKWTSLWDRSRTINVALPAWVARKDAVREMDARRAAVPKVSPGEAVRWIQEDREQEH
jgi:hypothetical protein